MHSTPAMVHSTPSRKPPPHTLLSARPRPPDLRDSIVCSFMTPAPFIAALSRALPRQQLIKARDFSDVGGSGAVVVHLQVAKMDRHFSPRSSPPINLAIADRIPKLGGSDVI